MKSVRVDGARTARRRAGRALGEFDSRGTGLGSTSTRESIDRRRGGRPSVAAFGGDPRLGLSIRQPDPADVVTPTGRMSAGHEQENAEPVGGSAAAWRKSGAW